MSNANNFSGTIWSPSNVFSCPATINHAVLILNRDINLNPAVLFRLWHSAKVKITVDGGTDRWFKLINRATGDSVENVKSMYLPDLITGDFDSIAPETLEKVRVMGLTVVETADQNETDYTKALRRLKQHCQLNNIQLDYIYVIVENCGRFDHIMANINTLYKSETFLDNIKVVHITSESLTWLLSIGNHKIYIPESMVNKKSWCGLIPFGSSQNSISTTGLKWNLNERCMKFGEMVSTSNTYSDSVVTVNTDVSIIWTMNIDELVKMSDSDNISQLCSVV